MRALAPTAVPVPAHGLLVHAEPDVLGAPFYVMELVDGRRSTAPPADLARLDADGARRLGHALVDTLAALHAVDPAAVGLADFGRPDGLPGPPGAPLGRSSWPRRAAASCPGIDELADRARRAVPATQRGRRSCTATTGWTTRS